MPRPLRVLELYAGIGGLSAALGGSVEIVAAVDINVDALKVYGHNFKHRRLAALIEGLSADELAAFGADLWWASPPCQPFTRRGRRLDLDDPRAATFKVFVQRVGQVRPRYLALENVVGFEGSAAHGLLHQELAAAGYACVRERVLCPSDFGWPNRRPRFYLVASLEATLSDVEAESLKPVVPLGELLDAETSRFEGLDDETYRRYRHAIHVVDAEDPTAIATCFTSAYGRSPVRSGSYLRTPQGPRYFSPKEVLRLLGFPPNYTLPEWSSGSRKDMKKAWRLIGNSLSLPPVRHALSSIPELKASGVGLLN